MNARSNPKDSPAAWKGTTRWTVSLLLLFHLLAVFLPPFAFQSSPVRGLGSPVAEAGMRLLRPYIDALYLNHGYAFFAPDPGPSHLLRARLEFADGRQSQTVWIPDLQRHWPRLMYHRYFMLSEHLNSAFTPADAPSDLPEGSPEMAEWKFVRRMYEARRAAIESHLQQQHGAERVTLERIEHRLLDPYEFVELNRRIDAEETYIVLPEYEPPVDGERR